MIVRRLGLDGVLEITSRKFLDDRGFFSEIYNEQTFHEAGIDSRFVQDNHSHSTMKSVVRGLHYQLPPHAQDKLVRVVRGAILDVVVDIRKSSPTFGKWISLEISAEKWNQIFVPKGFAHGFITLAENTEVAYKVTGYYSPQHDRSIRFDDPLLDIDWSVSSTDVRISEKDRNAPLLADAELFA